LQGKTCGLEDRTFGMDSIQVYADGKLFSNYVHEYEASLILNLNNKLRLHAGGKIVVRMYRE